MGTFNFNIKKQSYEACLNQSKALFLQDDMENGALYAKKAFQIVNELIMHCNIPEVKNMYILQSNQLRNMIDNVEKGINPFIKKKTNYNQNGGNNQNNGNTGFCNNNEEEVPTHEFFTTESPSITLKDIAGLDDVKDEIRLNVIAPLKNADIYYKYTDQVGCRILMYGPPGCGKSFIAEAIAGELKCAYAIVNAFDILDKYVGEAPKKIAQIFKEAEQFDNCLIFFDELDALFASRESDDSSHTKDVLTSFLTCLSGFNTSKDNKKLRIIIGATNRPWILDSALLRGKRLDTQLYVGLPDAEARKFLIKKEFKGREELITDTDITIDDLVIRLDGYSGADISAIMHKIKMRPLDRALDNKEKGFFKLELVTKADADAVISNYRNSVTKESLEAFEAFKNGEL